MVAPTLFSMANTAVTVRPCPEEMTTSERPPRVAMAPNVWPAAASEAVRRLTWPKSLDEFAAQRSTSTMSVIPWRAALLTADARPTASWPPVAMRMHVK